MRGTSWSTAAAGATANVTADGTTWVQFRALDKAGNASAWAPASADPDRRGDGRHAAAVAAGAHRRARAPGRTSASVIVQPTGTPADAGSGFAGYEYRTSTDGGSTWSAPTAGSSATIRAEGTTLVEFRSLDCARQRLRLDGDERAGADRPHAADRADRHRRIRVVAGRADGHVTAGGATDAGRRRHRLRVRDLHQRRQHVVCRHDRPDRGDLDAGHDARAVRGRRRGRAGLAVDAGDRQARPHRAVGARPWPAAPSTWSNAASATVTASGSTDTGGSGLSGYQYRTSTDGGTTWSAATSGPSDTVTAEANTWVQFRSVDVAGNTSAWTPATQTAGGDGEARPHGARARRSRAAASAGWSNAASVTITADREPTPAAASRATSTRRRRTTALPGRRRQP